MSGYYSLKAVCDPEMRVKGVFAAKQGQGTTEERTSMNKQPIKTMQTSHIHNVPEEAWRTLLDLHQRSTAA